MGRFESTVSFYERYRPGYSVSFFETIARSLRLDGSQRLIDLGTGPGLLAIGFAPFVSEVVGVDPEPAMLAYAADAAARANVRLELIEATTETLPEGVGCFQLVTVGRALHWMEREPTIRVLKRIVAADGAVLIASARTDASDERNEWLSAYKQVREHWMPAEERGKRRKLDLDQFFTGSGFGVRETVRVLDRRPVTVDDLIGRVLSMSGSSPERLGDKVSEMAEDMRQTLAPFAAREPLTEIVEMKGVMIRPNSSP